MRHSKRLRVGAAGLMAALSLTACTESDAEESTESATYCQLIGRETVEPIVAGRELKVFGGPEPKGPYRMIMCHLYDEDAPNGKRAVLNVFEYEFSADSAAEERSTAIDRKPKHVGQHFVELTDGDDVGYAYFTGDTAAALLVTDERRISVTAPADRAQAAEFVPVLLQVAQEIDQNLDAWDRDNPA